MADPPTSYCRDIRRAGTPGGQHWPYPQTMPRSELRVPYCRHHEPASPTSTAPATRRPPTSPGKALRTSVSRSGHEEQHGIRPALGELRRARRREYRVPGIRRPCLAGEASTTAGKSVRPLAPGAAARPRGRRHRSRATADSGRPLGDEPVMQALAWARASALQAAKAPGSRTPARPPRRAATATESSGRPVPVAVPAGGQQHGAAVQIELPARARAEADRGQHGGQRGGRVVRVVPMPQRVPLPAADDRVSEWYCSSSTPPGATRAARSASAAD